MYSAADGEDGNRLQLERMRLNFSSCFHAFFKTLILMAVVCFLLGIKVISFKDNVLNELSWLPLISG